jgi:hypothetical protein
MILRQDQPSRYAGLQCASRKLSPRNLPRERFSSLAPGGPSDKNKGSLPRNGPLKRRSKTNMKMARLRTPVRLRAQRESSMAATISTVVGASWSRLAPRFADD